MLNLIDSFFDLIENNKVFIADREKEEVYFFMGKKGLLCISRTDNRVLHNLSFSGLQIQIMSPVKFILSSSKNLPFFIHEENEFSEKVKVPIPDQFTFKTETDKGGGQEKYKYRAFCEQCNGKKCSQYDTINGRNFKFGGGPISEDMLAQHDAYCEKKINKFQCLNKKMGDAD